MNVICRSASLIKGASELGNKSATKAIENLNSTPLNGKPIRIMYSNRDPSTRKSWEGNIFIKNLDKSIDHKALHETFSSFCNILSCKVATDSSGQSKGYGFVQFESNEAAHNAIENLNGMCHNGRPVFVGRFLHQQERDNSSSTTKFTNVFVKNLTESTTKEELDKIFGEYGNITSSVLMTEEDGKSRCFGFVNFENSDDAARAVQELNGKKSGEKEWFAGKALKKYEREVELKAKLDQAAKEAAKKFLRVNLYLKNLDNNISEEKLRDIFLNLVLTSCKVVQDHNSVGRGSGFVAFSSPDEASRVLAEMNGKLIGSKPLYMAFAQRKEERRAHLEAQFSQMRPVSMPPNVGPWMLMYPRGVPKWFWLSADTYTWNETWFWLSQIIASFWKTCRFSRPICAIARAPYVYSAGHSSEGEERTSFLAVWDQLQ